jgi:hypothetical protein
VPAHRVTAALDHQSALVSFEALQQAPESSFNRNFLISFYEAADAGEALLQV